MTATSLHQLIQQLIIKSFIILSILFLVSCGGGGTGGSNSESQPGSSTNGNAQSPSPDTRRPLGQVPYPDSKPVSADIRIINQVIGIGPAFQNERPNIGNLPSNSETQRDDIIIRSGYWSDPFDRDGAYSSAQVIEFLRSFQQQSYRESGADADLIVIDLSIQRTLRISGNASDQERKIVLAALRNINASLTWDRRVLIGTDIENLTPDPSEITEGEIHIHFTDGKSTWPDPPNEEDSKITLGIGGTSVKDDGSYQISSGFAFIDRTAVRNISNSPNVIEFVITHELLHAFGLGAHVTPTEYPDSLLIPTLRSSTTNVPRIYLSLDGELFQAEAQLTPGTQINDLTSGSLTGWADESFHLLGSSSLSEFTTNDMQFGVSFRNNLSKPWAYGSQPRIRLRDNSAAFSAGNATWRGDLIGVTDTGRTVAGNAEIGVTFSDYSGIAKFSELEAWGVRAHPGNPGSGTTWGDGDLHYSLELKEESGADIFTSSFLRGDDPGVVTGTFVGAAHEGATGVLEHPNLSAAFGSTR